jgi:hypothetical protein
MPDDPQFLSFKGLKHYSPEQGWGQVNDILQSRMQPRNDRSEMSMPPSPSRRSAYQEEKIPTLTESAPHSAAHDEQGMVDPLIHELFEQLQTPPNDELTQTWRTISAEVNLLTQRMSLQRELLDRLDKLDSDIQMLRDGILEHLHEVQRAADQQVSSARLRAEVSALAQSKLASRLKK